MPIRKYTYIEEEAEQVRSLYCDKGFTFGGVVDALGFSYFRVSEYFKKFGIPVRTLAQTQTQKYNFAHLTEAEKGYMAGLIDGEGWIRSDGEIGLENTNLEVIEWLRNKLGCGSLYTRPPRENPNHRQTYSIKVSYIPGRMLLEILKPYMIIKQDKC